MTPELWMVYEEKLSIYSLSSILDSICVFYDIWNWLWHFIVRIKLCSVMPTWNSKIQYQFFLWEPSLWTLLSQDRVVYDKQSFLSLQMKTKVVHHNTRMTHVTHAIQNVYIFIIKTINIKKIPFQRVTGHQNSFFSSSPAPSVPDPSHCCSSSSVPPGT